MQSTGTTASVSKQYFPQLTGLRSLAAYAVFLSHIIPNKDHAQNSFLGNVSATGYLGVTVFFVLSGFLIAYRYYDSFLMEFHWFKRYMINRIAKIYPMYFILTLATFIYNHLMGINKIDPIVFVTNITFLRGYFDDFLFTGITQGWSLTVEETFYLIAPFLFLFTGKKNGLLYLSIVFISAGLFLVAIFSRINFYHFMGNLDFMFYYTFFGRCIEFFLGIQLALRLKAGIQQKRTGATIAGTTGMALFVVLLVIFKDYSHAAFNPWLVLFLNNVAFPVAVYYFLLGLITEDTFFKKFLATKPMVVLGKSSYTFYLIHVGFICYFINDRFHLNSISLFIVLNLISIALYYLMEHPLNDLIRRLNPKASQSAALN